MKVFYTNKMNITADVITQAINNDLAWEALRS